MSAIATLDNLLKKAQLMTRFLIILLTAALIVSSLLSMRSAVSAQQMGAITGALSYPSDFDFPKMIVCAESRDLKKIHCTDRRAAGRRRGKFTYRLRVPAGSYYVFATIVNGSEPVEDGRGYKAYYSEFVKCGLSVDCPSHEPAKVTVRAGQTVTGIDPGDWYVDN